ncbi:MAG: J domain-containing protein [Polyangiaceae bacterium]
MDALLLPSNLEKTTLGDVLGLLLRGRATGFLELGDGASKSHVFLSSGRPTAVASTAAKLWPNGAPQRLGELLLERGFVGRSDLERAACARADGRLLGELLLDEGALDQRTIEGAMAAQTAERLDRLYALRKGSMRFRVATFGAARPPIPLRAAFSSPQLHPAIFLTGRPRARTRRPSADASRRDALRVLRLDAGATAEDIRRAFKQLVVELHPDRAADEADRALRSAAMKQITVAYAKLAP